jgi:phage major head subunit gpT-like protein
MPLITPAAISALQPGFHANFQQGFRDAKPWGEQILTTISSNTTTEVYGFMGRTLAMRQWIGPRLLRDLESYAQSVTNVSYELTIAVGTEEIADDRLGVYGPRFQMLGNAARMWPSQLLKTRLQANGNGFDGVAYFAATHPLDPAGNQDNDFNLALTPANYATVREAMMAFTGNDGEPLEVMPDLLIVPPALERQAKEILLANIIPDPGAVAAGVTNVNAGTAKLLVVPALNNEPTRWYLADTSLPMKPWLFQQRKAPELVMKDGPSDDNVFWDQDVVYGLDSRGNVAPGPWWLMARSTP